ncbi:MAG: hypothetical protein DLM59_04560 [Pseudonocardiales bacterium]|nr:MAG: hypothetical protein DLM59_04560 [Pseudonocardiales bacterium]
MRLLALVMAAGVVVAVVRAIQQRHWAVAVVLSAVAVCTVACPLADAAVSRRSEYAADRFAASPRLARTEELRLPRVEGRLNVV